MGVLRATPSRLVLLRSWKVDLQRISFRLDGSAGVTYQGAARGSSDQHLFCMDGVVHGNI